VLVIPLFLFAACQRPFVATTTPDIEIIEPDFSTVFSTDETLLRVRASSFRDVPLVQIDGQPMSFNREQNAWESRLQLGIGLNSFVLTAFDTEGVFQTDTLSAVRFPLQFSAASIVMPVSTAHHTATLLRGETLFTGGAASAGGPALSDAFTLRFGDAGPVPIDPGLKIARTGHTATLMPDGRVLIMGGSRSDNLTEVNQLVEAPEVFNPVTRTFSVVPVSGEPIRRELHTAILRQTAIGPVVDLLGGRGDIQYRPTARLGTRSDLRSFLFRNDSLIALSPAPGPIIEAIAGQTETATTPVDQGEFGRYLVSGSFFDSRTGTPDETSLILDYRNTSIGLRISETEHPFFARTGHSAIGVRPGFVLLLGGQQAAPNQLVDTPELYVDSVGKYFRFPDTMDTSPLRRTGHSATFVGPSRILLVGGFGADGTALPSTEFIDFEF